MIVAEPSLASSSCTAATATVCAVFQFEVVKESEDWLPAVVESVSMVSSEPAVTSTVTVADGSVSRATVKDPDAPSVTVSVVTDTSSPCSSSSVTVTATGPAVTLP